MHIPDGFLANKIAYSLDALSAASILYAAQRVKQEVSARVVPVMGVFSAFIFIAQMLNFPLFGGTSGHLVGGALLGIVLGPMAGFLTISTVVVAQALFLQDGGMVALGANLFNIAALPVFLGYLVHRLLGAPHEPGGHLRVAGFLAGWISVVAAAAACAVQLGLSNVVPLSIGLPAMAGYHVIIGVFEGLLTAAVLSFLARVRPELLRKEFRPAVGVADWAGGIVLVAIPAVILALAGSSELPDPLQAILGAPAAVADARESLVSPARYTDQQRYLIYLVMFCVCVVAYNAARMIRVRRGRP